MHVHISLLAMVVIRLLFYCLDCIVNTCNIEHILSCFFPHFLVNTKLEFETSIILK